MDEDTFVEVEGQRRKSPSSHVIHEAVMREGVEELARSSSSLFWSGLAAGLSMGFSLIAEVLLRAHLPDATWELLVAKLGYAVGFLIVILGRQQLFTENTLTPILPLLHRKDRSTFMHLGRLWSIVFVANIVGGIAIGWVVGATDMLREMAHPEILAVGREAMEPAWTDVMFRAVFAGWLIAIMVWMLPFAGHGRIWIIVILTYIIGIGHFPHVIAGSIAVFAYAAAGAASWPAVFGHYVLPALVGNVVGGVTLVAALNHAQVVAGKEVT